MRIDYARVSTTEQNLGLQPDDLKLAYDASVDPTEARNVAGSGPVPSDPDRPNPPVTEPLTDGVAPSRLMVPAIRPAVGARRTGQGGRGDRAGRGWTGRAVGILDHGSTSIKEAGPSRSRGGPAPGRPPGRRYAGRGRAFPSH
jgi:hypothetical protein